jgi:transcriptional regulator with XRE-family HTH domain
MANLRELLSYNIKKRREKLGISQAKLAERADTSTNYIAQIEQQSRFPSSEMLERLAIALGIDSQELFSSLPFPFPLEAIQQFHEGLKADFEKRLERLIKSNK